ncbi:MAG: chemotaxis-specific protein-glutamate methyltransferase CheB [Pseudomonadota bacterium]
MVRVLIVDDSPTLRILIRRILESDPGIQVVGEAANGEDAIALCRKLNPDIITMDIHMPGIDGYEAIRHIMAEMPRPIVVLTSTESDIRLGITFKAIECGALMVLRKPKGMPEIAPQAGSLISQLKAMADVKVVRRTKWSQMEPSKMPGKAERRNGSRMQPLRLVTVGVSTGGPPALQVILSRLPAGFPAPILVVQHMSRGFINGLATWLNETTPLQVKVAQPYEKLKTGTVYLAPDEKHLTVMSGGSAWLKEMPPVDGHCPSATALFESAASSGNGPATVGVILTGMGSDGARGLKKLHDAGGYTIAQDEASSIIFGMPKEAIAMGAVNEVLPLEMISDRLKELVTG